jgi:hypothetical protein
MHASVCVNESPGLIITENNAKTKLNASILSEALRQWKNDGHLGIQVATQNPPRKHKCGHT